MKKFVLIVAGGKGNRMNSKLPKQFLEINGRPILMHTFDTFLNYDSELIFVLVLPKEEVDTWNDLCKKHQFQVDYKLAFGGETRFYSVKNGLDVLPDVGVVFIHDGVRPLVSKQTLKNCFETAKRKGNALPVISVPESIRMKMGKNSSAVDRSKYFLVQTPQTFETGMIKEAYQKAETDTFTDDATVLEDAGETIHLVEGNRENIKITFPEDLILAKSILS